MKYKYDFHIHSCLSPCGDMEMTPNNIVNMYALMECDIIAITDHNTCKNAPAILQIAESVGVLALPGMELCSLEDAHIVCLFEELEMAMKFDEYINENIPSIKNKSEIFGRQVIMNEMDEEIGEEEKLLITATNISAEDIVRLTSDFGGVAFPAHVDKDSYSLIASLGMIPEEYGFNCIELSQNCNEEEFFEKFPELKDYKVMHDSDLHYLENITEDFDEIELEELTRKAVIQYFRKNKKSF